MPAVSPWGTGQGLEHTLPSSWYQREDIYRLELQHIFLREWICVGREEMLQEAGDHIVLAVHEESILLVRNQAEKLKGFYNVCRHRGARLCPAVEDNKDHHRQPIGGGVVNKSAILCPYHSWRYDLDGQLTKAPHMEGQAGLRMEDVQLYPVGVRTWGGFIFISLRPELAPDFGAYVRAPAENFIRYPLKARRQSPDSLSGPVLRWVGRTVGLILRSYEIASKGMGENSIFGLNVQLNCLFRYLSAQVYVCPGK